jgi:hypothetical protein
MELALFGDDDPQTQVQQLRTLVEALAAELKQVQAEVRELQKSRRLNEALQQGLRGETGPAPRRRRSGRQWERWLQKWAQQRTLSPSRKTT